MTATPSLDLLERALDQAGALISGVRADQAGLPTPCSEFDVRTLINHIVFDVRVFAANLSGAERSAPGADLIGQDWVGAYEAAQASLLDAWHQKGIEGTITTRLGEFPSTWAVGQHLANLAVHAWDVATATHQARNLDQEVARVALHWGRENLKPQYRGTTFGPEVEVPENAPIYERLAGFFGRNPF